MGESTKVDRPSNVTRSAYTAEVKILPYRPSAVNKMFTVLYGKQEKMQFVSCNWAVIGDILLANSDKKVCSSPLFFFLVRHFSASVDK